MSHLSHVSLPDLLNMYQSFSSPSYEPLSMDNREDMIRDVCSEIEARVAQKGICNTLLEMATLTDRLLRVALNAHGFYEFCANLEFSKTFPGFDPCMARCQTAIEKSKEYGFGIWFDDNF